MKPTKVRLKDGSEAWFGQPIEPRWTKADVINVITLIAFIVFYILYALPQYARQQ